MDKITTDDLSEKGETRSAEEIRSALQKLTIIYEDNRKQLNSGIPALEFERIRFERIHAHLKGYIAALIWVLNPDDSLEGTTLSEEEILEVIQSFNRRKGN